MRCKPDGTFEQPDQLKAREPGEARKIIKTEIFRIARAHQLDDPVEGGSVLRRALGAADAAAVPLEKHAEGVDDDLVSAEIVTFCLEGAVQAAESFYHLDIIDHVRMK